MPPAGVPPDNANGEPSIQMLVSGERFTTGGGLTFTVTVAVDAQL